MILVGDFKEAEANVLRDPFTSEVGKARERKEGV